MKKIISAIIIICIIIIGFIAYKSMTKLTVKANVATLMHNSSSSNTQKTDTSNRDNTVSNSNTNTGVNSSTGNNSRTNATNPNSQSQSATASSSSNIMSGQNNENINQETVDSSSTSTVKNTPNNSDTSNIQSQKISNNNNNNNNDFLSYYNIPNIYKSPGYIHLTSDNLFGNYTLSKIIGGKNNGFCPTIYVSSQLFASNGTNQINPEYILACININYLTTSEQIANYLGGENTQLLMLIAVPQNASKETIHNYIKNAEQSPCNYPVLTKNGLVTFPNTNQILIFKR